MYRTIGQNLRAARESAGLTLLDVAHRTRIPPGRLQLLEDGNFAAFGSMAYARSFLKSYSRFLEVDASEALEGLPPPVLGGPADYRYLTESQGPWIDKSERLPRRREPLKRVALSPVPSLVFMLALFLVAGALLAARLVDIKKTEHKAAEKGAAVTTQSENAMATTDPQHLVVNAQALESDVGASAKSASSDGSGGGAASARQPLPKETIVRPAVLPKDIPAPVSPNTPVRRPQIVE